MQILFWKNIKDLLLVELILSSFSDYIIILIQKERKYWNQEIVESLFSRVRDNFERNSPISCYPERDEMVKYRDRVEGRFRSWSDKIVGLRQAVPRG